MNIWCVIVVYTKTHIIISVPPRNIPFRKSYTPLSKPIKFDSHLVFLETLNHKMPPRRPDNTTNGWRIP